MKKIACLLFLASLTSTVVLAQDIPLRNWTVPPYTASSSTGIHTMTDITEPRAFVGLAVCRLLDTRPPVNNPLDGDGAYGTDTIRTYTVTGACGIPAGADAVSLNITVTNTVSNPFGHLKIWPASQAEPNVSTLNWNTGGVTESNAAIVALSGAGQLRVKTGNAGADVILDVNGYFSDTLFDQTNVFRLVNNSGLYTINTTNSSTTCGAHCGIVANISSTAGGWAVTGFANGATGANVGVRGETNSASANSYGVHGVTATNLITSNLWVTAGVRGDGGNSIGVLGLANGIGILGRNISTTGVAGNWGELGNASYGVFSSGPFAATGAKAFVEPHPTDASKVIKFIALEGNEPGTYFRGRGRFERGVARITVPEDFRLVTDDEGLSVQVTPIGAMATVAVLRADLNEIVVQSSRNVEFYYTVNGIRRTHKELVGHAITDAAEEYRPLSADASIPENFTPLQKQWLIQNGTYKADGKVNMETAQRLGWDRIWYEHEHPAPELRTQTPRKD